VVAEDLEDLYENAPCGYVSLDREGRIVKSNQTFSTWTGYSRESLLGKRLRDLLNIAGAMFYETHFAPLLRMQGFFHEVALDFVKADGQKLPVLANAAEKRDEDGNLLFTRLTIFQATERRRYERELVEAKAAAVKGLQAEQLASELREQFVAVLGHDLRNPLAGLEAGLRRLQRTGMTEQTPQLLELMQGSVQRMNVLIDNVLDLTRSRLGGGLQLHIDRGRPLEPTLLQVVEELRAVWVDRVIETRFALDDAVDCDHGRLAQLLSNLLGNALTHGDSSEPVRVEAETGAGSLVLSVANSGTPIPPETVDRLFQPFYRGGEGRSHRHGLGLGLFISAQIAIAHRGELSVASDAKETRFTLRMPVTQDVSIPE
jgi:phosphoserine phosphatase RsbU/P